MAIADLHDAGHLLRRFGKDDHVGAVFFDDEAIAFKDDQVAVCRQYGLPAKKLGQLVNHVKRNGNIHEATVGRDRQRMNAPESGA